MYNKYYSNRENYNNLNNIKTDCDCYDSINHKDKLITPSAINIPIDNTIFNTRHNIEQKNKMKITGKYCFPIEKYLYDGVWNSNIKNDSNKQTIKWDIPNNKQIEDIYCGDKLLILPEKQMKQGDVIIQKGNCNEFYPSIYQINERLHDKCHKRNIYSDVKKTTLDEYTINGL